MREATFSSPWFQPKTQNSEFKIQEFGIHKLTNSECPFFLAILFFAAPFFGPNNFATLFIILSFFQYALGKNHLNFKPTSPHSAGEWL